MIEAMLILVVTVAVMLGAIFIPALLLDAQDRRRERRVSEPVIPRQRCRMDP